MIERETLWAYVKPFSYVRDKAGKVWRVDQAQRTPRGIVVILTDREGRTGRPAEYVHEASPVTVLEPTEAEALATLRGAFGEMEIIDEQ